MTQKNDIRLRPDGSIDTGHYMAIGRRMRSERAHEMARGIAPAPRPKRSPGLFAFLEALIFQRA